jgi:KDO2-lipid IV(A) lauroyltransferase
VSAATGVRRAETRPLKRLKRWLRFQLVRGGLGLLSLLPLSVAQRLGEGLGAAGYRLAGRERRRALDSLAVAFPGRSRSEHAALARACFRHLGRMALELACIRQIDAQLTTFVAWPEEDRRVFAEAHARGKGVLLVTGHIGSWELLARRIVAGGFPESASIAREASDPRMTALLEHFRRSGGLTTLWRGDPGVARAMLRTLRSGKALGLLIDQDTRVQSVFVPFFGRLAATPRAAADLALRTGAALLVAACPREDDGRYRLTVREVPVPGDVEDREAAALALTATLNRHLEEAIRAHPEQWVWMHERWKTRPAGEG